MSKSLQICVRDLKRILRNPVAIVIVLGVCAVPCLYAWINIAANWDPYENTSGIPVAVVNQDQPATVADKGEICTGDMMVEKLSENDKIGWQFVDEAQALEGVRAGTYYAAIVIPEDFTKNLTGVLDGSIQKAHLKYYVNEKVNAIAPKVTDTGASTVESTIDEQFVATVGEVVSEKLGGVLSGLITDSKTAVEDIVDALEKVHTTIDGVDGKLGDLAESLQNAQKALVDASDHLAQYEGVGAGASNAIADALEGFGQVRASSNELMSDISSALGDGAHTLSSLSSQASHDISSVAGDVAAAQSQLNAAIRALGQDLTDNEALVSKISSTRDLIIQINPTDEHDKSLKLEIERSFDQELDFLVQISDAQRAKIDELRALVTRLETAANDLKDLSTTVDDKVQDATGSMLDAQKSAVGETLLEVSNALDSFVQIGQQLETALEIVDPIITQTITVTKQLAQTLEQNDDALSATRQSIGEIGDSVGSLTNELAAIRASETWALLESLAKTNPEGVHDFLTAPVTISSNRLYPVENYASGVAPFFTSLALWVGGIALVAIFKLEVDDEEVGPVKPWQAYFGRWLLFVPMGTLQAIICCTGDLLLGIQCEQPWALYLSAIVASFAFINIIFALSVAFKHIGKALAFVLVILQVPGSSGMYPIEMMPAFFQALNPWLPFTYSNNAMREAIAGFYDGNLAKYLAALLLFVIPSILIGVSARIHLMNVNSLFDRRLRETDHLMVSEPVAVEATHYRLASVVKAIRAPQEYRMLFEQRSAAFERAYPALVRRGLLALLIVPLVLFALMLLHEAKLLLMACWAASIVLICAFLIVAEYFHDRIQRKVLLTDLSEDEINEVLVNALREETLALAPVDKLIELRSEKLQRQKHTRPIQRIRQHVRKRPERDASGKDDDSTKGGDAQ